MNYLEHSGKFHHSVGSSFLQTGHVLLSLSHGFKHSGWKVCPQGRNMPSSPNLKSVMHTEHVGISTSPVFSFFFPCLCYILTTGNCLTTFCEVGFLLGYY